MAELAIVLHDLMFEFDDDEALDGDNDFPSYILAFVNQKREKVPRIEGFVETVVPQYTSWDFKYHFRISRVTFERLLGEVGPELYRDYCGGNTPLLPDKQCLTFLWYACNQSSMRGVSHMFGLSKSTVHSCIHKVAATISTRRHSVIRWPDQTRQAHIAEGFAGESCLRGIVGVIDGTHIRIINILNGQPDYINRKSYPSVQLQLVVDDMMLITDAYVGWPGSVHDARVFRNSPLYHDVEDGHKLAEHQYLIGDTAYPLRSWLVTPFKDNGHLSQQQRRFNRMLSGKRQVVERAIGHLKGRFRRLRELMFHDISQICQFIMATCVMHNLCVLSDDDVSSFINFDDQDDMELENIFADATGGHVRRNALVAQC